MNVVSHPQLD